MIFLLHLLKIPSPAHFLFRCGKHAYYPLLKIAHLIPLFWQPLHVLLTGGYLQLQMWDLWSRRPDVLTNQEKVRGPRCFEMVIAWKESKLGVLREVALFFSNLFTWATKDDFHYILAISCSYTLGRATIQVNPFRMTPAPHFTHGKSRILPQTLITSNSFTLISWLARRYFRRLWLHPTACILFMATAQTKACTWDVHDNHSEKW